VTDQRRQVVGNLSRPGLRLAAAPLVYFAISFVFGATIFFLDLSRKLIFVAFDLFDFVVGQLAPFFASFTLILVPIALDRVPIHGSISSVSVAIFGICKR